MREPSDEIDPLAGALVRQVVGQASRMAMLNI